MDFCSSTRHCRACAAGAQRIYSSSGVVPLLSNRRDACILPRITPFLQFPRPFFDDSPNTPCGGVYRTSLLSIDPTTASTRQHKTTTRPEQSSDYLASPTGLTSIFSLPSLLYIPFSSSSIDHQHSDSRIAKLHERHHREQRFLQERQQQLHQRRQQQQQTLRQRERRTQRKRARRQRHPLEPHVQHLRRHRD